MAKKLKGKQWFQLISPKMFGQKPIGETPVGDPKTLINRRVEVQLTSLINDFSKYYFKVYFRITDVNDTKAHTKFDGLECMRDYISRMIRHGIEKIDIVQDLTTKDGKKIRLKSLTLANRRIKRGVENEIRKFVSERLKSYVEKNDLENLLEKIINDSIKKEIKKNGSIVYPIRAFEFRKVQMLKPK